MTPFVRKRLAAAAAALMLAAAAPQASDPAPLPPDTMALQTDSHDFVTRSDASLTALGNPMRFGGLNLSWLGLRTDTGRAADLRYPTTFEVGDALATVSAMGSGVIRVASLGLTAGCPRCAVPQPGRINEDALRQMDAVLQQAHDRGIKLIIPLAGPAANCEAAAALDPLRDTSCIFARWRHQPDAAFFTDPAIRADFNNAVATLLQHVNSFTNIPYRNDPTILAWENCDACGHGVDDKTLAAWTEQLGHTIKSIDTRHLYENGAFAGRIAAVGAPAIAADLLALPSVDIVGDRMLGSAGDKPDHIPLAVDAVTHAGRIYVIDLYGWSPTNWPTPEALQAFLDGVVKNRDIAGALVSDLQGHADGGGYLPVIPNAPPGTEPPLYFPSARIGPVDPATMQARARAVRRFSYHMMDLDPPAFLTLDPPVLIAAKQGKLTWRGAAGATVYSVERTGDLIATGSWENICDSCVTDDQLPWIDHTVPAKPTWYRVTPHNANGHAGLPSAPMQNVSN